MTDLSVSPIGTELLDDPAADPVVVAASLRHLARANRWFGGAAAVRYGLRRLLANEPPGSTLSLLDLGTGTGDLPRAAVRWGAARGLRIVPVGIELSRIAARLALESGVPTAVASAGAPPMRDKSVDLVLVSQVAHHLAPRSAVRLFHTCDRLARRGVVVADLRRNGLGRLAFWCGAHLLGFDRVTIADGLTSLRRGYTKRELLALLSAAGVGTSATGTHASDAGIDASTATVDAYVASDASVVRRPGYRLVATWRPRAA